MPIFLDPQGILLFDIPLFLFLFGLIFLIVRFLFKQYDPIMGTGIAAFAGGAAFIIVRSQFEIQRWLWFNTKVVWALFIIVIILMVIYWMLKF